MTEQDPACCSPGGDRVEPEGRDASIDHEVAHEEPPAPGSTTGGDTDGMVEVPAGEFRMGTDSDVGFPQDGEGPTREVYTDAFYIDRTEVTNGEFARFVADTGYTTEAEEFGWSFVFGDFVESEEYVMREVPGAPWWVAVRGANWKRPEGPGSDVKDRLDHPVVHVSYRDALAYADWAGKRLPTEAEWEKAARGGLEGARYPWGDELRPGDEYRCNIWQGEFPEENTGDDGYLGTAPADAFEQNDWGLCNVSGNVWNWCADWFSPEHHATDAYDPHNPTGPADGDGRVMRGGSFLCHRSYCNRYRVAARSSNTPDSATANIGFRCAADA
ncbi:MAG: formylglycine-generating enzyme family protein [Halobacteriaceae archaeon]